MQHDLSEGSRGTGGPLIHVPRGSVRRDRCGARIHWQPLHHVCRKCMGTGRDRTRCTAVCDAASSRNNPFLDCTWDRRAKARSASRIRDVTGSFKECDCRATRIAGYRSPRTSSGGRRSLHPRNDDRHRVDRLAILHPLEVAEPGTADADVERHPPVLDSIGCSSFDRLVSSELWASSTIRTFPAGRCRLVDPDRPGWYRPLFVRFMLRNETTVELPVDSSDRRAVQEWADRIRAMNLDA
jgi:hypothetical protein